MPAIVAGDFESDSDKAEINACKHGVSFEEAATAFEEPAAVLLDDPKSDGRYWLIGFSIRAHERGSSPHERQEDMKRNSTAHAESPAEAEDDGLGVDARELRVRGRGLRTGKRFDLRTLRTAVGCTQTDVAQRMSMDQSQISKIEAGADHLVTTLRRYAEALGGELDVAIVLGGRRYRIGFAADAKRPDTHRLECAEPGRSRSTRAKLRQGK